MTHLTAQSMTRIAEIRERVLEAQALIKRSARVDNNKLVITLEFEDEIDMLEQWVQAICDCHSLLCILDGSNSHD